MQCMLVVQLRNAKGAHSKGSKDLEQAEEHLTQALAEKQRLAAKLATVEDDRASLQEQLQEVCWCCSHLLTILLCMPC